MKKTVILGIGNTILRDEGLGVKALELLKRDYEFTPEVELLDGGTLGIDLLYFLEGAERLLVLDAVLGGGKPGDLYIFKGDGVKSYFRRKVSMHEIGFQEVLGLLELRGSDIKEIVVMGIEPKDIELGTELSPEVEGSLPELVNEALKQLEEWGIRPVQRLGMNEEYREDT